MWRGVSRAMPPRDAVLIVVAGGLAFGLGVALGRVTMPPTAPGGPDYVTIERIDLHEGEAGSPTTGGGAHVAAGQSGSPAGTGLAGDGPPAGGAAGPGGQQAIGDESEAANAEAKRVEAESDTKGGATSDAEDTGVGVVGPVPTSLVGGSPAEGTAAGSDDATSPAPELGQAPGGASAALSSSPTVTPSSPSQSPSPSQSQSQSSSPSPLSPGVSPHTGSAGAAGTAGTAGAAGATGVTSQLPKAGAEAPKTSSLPSKAPAPAPRPSTPPTKPAPQAPGPASPSAATQRQEKMLMPVQGRIISDFGWRRHPVFADWRYHTGVDIATAQGTQVRAALSGKVLEVKNDRQLGLCVLLEHQDGLRTRYGHLESSPVSPGDRVTQGQAIGRAGSSGVTAGCYLHFEVIREGKAQDPRDFL
ncbi:MAG: peptidoglycan DD-metalloendopeptidase family protein [Bacillota bacterium]|nr:peptidoglycan DD-metalloendopeptidase family protein [Bacillota bacterium]